MSSKILITGGTGLIGKRLTKRLNERGDKVVILTTSAIKAEEPDYFYWNLKDEYIDARAFDGVDTIIHLAGAAVADKKWTKKRKQLIYDSRVKNTNLLFERASSRGIKSVIAASAIGFYGLDAGDTHLNESSPKQDDFFSEVVGDW